MERTMWDSRPKSWSCLNWATVMCSAVSRQCYSCKAAGGVAMESRFNYSWCLHLVTGEQETWPHTEPVQRFCRVLFPNHLLSLYTVVGSLFLITRTACVDVSFPLVLQISVTFFLFFPRKLGMGLILGAWRRFFSWSVSVGGSRFSLKWLANADNSFHWCGVFLLWKERLKTQPPGGKDNIKP